MGFEASAGEATVTVLVQWGQGGRQHSELARFLGVKLEITEAGHSMGGAPRFVSTVP